MNRRSLIAASAAALLPMPALAQSTWPSQPIRLVVPFAAGGPTDVPARMFAEALSEILPQRVIVENRTGAGVVVGSDMVARAPKDGHTLLYTTIAHSVLRPLFPQLPFDPAADFQPVALLGVIPMVLLVNKDLPAQTMPELIKLLRDNPGEYDYGSSGNGGAIHLATELLLKRAGDLKVSHIPYRGSSAALPDLLAGRLAMFMDVAANGLSYAGRGDVRALGVSAEKRLPQAPEIPTFAESGIEGAESYTWHMVMAPVGTPEPVVQAANAAFNKAAAQENIQRRLAELAMTVRSDTTPASAQKWLTDETAKWEGIIRDAGIQPS